MLEATREGIPVEDTFKGYPQSAVAAVKPGKRASGETTSSGVVHLSTGDPAHGADLCFWRQEAERNTAAGPVGRNTGRAIPLRFLSKIISVNIVNIFKL